jgi:hypothetical protein
MITILIITVFLEVTTCSLVDHYRGYGGTYCLHPQGRKVLTSVAMYQTIRSHITENVSTSDLTRIKYITLPYVPRCMDYINIFSTADYFTVQRIIQYVLPACPRHFSVLTAWCYNFVLLWIALQFMSAISKVTPTPSQYHFIWVYCHLPPLHSPYVVCLL